jgi:hypothetical protein
MRVKQKDKYQSNACKSEKGPENAYKLSNLRLINSGHFFKIKKAILHSSKECPFIREKWYVNSQ